MSTIERIRCTLDEYQQMVEAGVFEGPRKIYAEFIRGELCPMSPIGTVHTTLVSRLNRWSARIADAKEFDLRIQSPILCPAQESAPEPDVVWAANKDYSKRHPADEDVLLLIEVADSSLSKDRGEKADLYAEAGIRDYWIVNAVDSCVEVFRDPVAGHYRWRHTYTAKESVATLAFPDVALDCATLFRVGV